MRELALAMNAVIIGNGETEFEGAAGVDAWHRLSEIRVPVTVACGDLDVPFIVDRCRLLAGRLPIARHVVLPGMAHQPYLLYIAESALMACRPGVSRRALISIGSVISVDDLAPGRRPGPELVRWGGYGRWPLEDLVDVVERDDQFSSPSRASSALGA